MLSLFKNKKNKNPVETNERDRIAKMIVIKSILLQQQWAARMQYYSQRLSVKWKVIILTLFCFCAGGSSLVLIAKSLTGNRNFSYRITQIKNPLSQKAGDEKVRIDEIISKEQYNKIEHFRRYMDSLARSPSGKIVYNNILISHPGLMDSLVLFENIYQLQNKK